MPVYEYECPQCDKVFEIQQRIADEPVRECPECGGEVKKLISMSSFQLKGNGWYADGYSSTSRTDNGEKNGASKADDKKTTPPAPSSPCKSEGTSAACQNCPAAS